MSENASFDVRPEIQTTPPQPRRGGHVWLWVVVIILFVFVAPTIGCGAFGLAFAVGRAEPTGAGLGPAVGVIRVEGTIMSGESSSLNSTAGSDTIVGLIKQAAEDSSVKAIVLRIDSPGGGVVASDEIYHALQQLDKPIVVSMGSLAASGGYYIAVPADYIYANPHTLVGSIGVISQFVTAEDLLDDIGVQVVVITAGDSKDFGSFARDMTDEEREYWADLLNETHEAFIHIVAEGRNMDEEAVRALANGLVYSGERGLELGLVDEIGYFDDAVRKAADLGGISGEPRVVEFTPEVSFWDALYGFQAQQNPAFSLNLLREMAVPSLEFRYLGP
jgi:protease-4